MAIVNRVKRKEPKLKQSSGYKTCSRAQTCSTHVSLHLWRRRVEGNIDSIIIRRGWHQKLWVVCLIHTDPCCITTERANVESYMLETVVIRYLIFNTQSDAKKRCQDETQVIK